VEEKSLFWLQAGTSLLLIVDPGTRSVHVYRTVDRISVFQEQDPLDASDVVPGWKVSVGEIFA
jgi:Uma2 family endonuclease